MNMRFVGILTLAFSILITSCGTLFTGTSSTFIISSEPDKAKVYVNGMYSGQTPTSMILKKDKDYNIVLKKDGYEDASAIVSRSFNLVSILNLLSPLCWLVDVVTGGVWKFDQEGVTVQMDPIKNKSGSIQIDSSLKMTTLKNGKTAIYQ